MKSVSGFLIFLLALAACGGDAPGQSSSCQSQAECTDPAHPYCFAQTCVECDVDQACPADRPACDNETHTCGVCAGAVDCARFDDQGVCAPDGRCVDCASNLDCGVDVPRCEVAAGECSGCRSEDECARFADRPHCDARGRCVTCRDSADCPASAPICNTDTAQCGQCAKHDDCVSGICDLDGGTCIADGDVLHVKKGATGTSCTRGDPCAGVAQAYTKVAGSRKYIRVHAGTYDGASLSGKDFVLVGPGAVIRARPQTTVLALAQLGSVTVEGVELRGGRASAGDGGHGIEFCGSGTLTIRDARVVDNVSGVVTTCGSLIVRDSTLQENRLTAMEVSAAPGAEVTVERSTVSTNGDGIRVTRGGGKVTMSRSRIGGGFVGIDCADVSCHLVNNVFVGVGAGSSGFITNAVELSGGYPDQIEHNTIVDNKGPGILCKDGAAASTFRNNIVARNIVKAGESQVQGGACSHRYSLIWPGPLPTGDGNLSVEPKFQTDGFHLAPGSPGIKAAAPAGTVNADIDGEHRPSSGADIGADEVVTAP